MVNIDNIGIKATDRSSKSHLEHCRHSIPFQCNRCQSYHRIQRIAKFSAIYADMETAEPLPTYAIRLKSGLKRPPKIHLHQHTKNRFIGKLFPVGKIVRTAKFPSRLKITCKIDDN